MGVLALPASAGAQATSRVSSDPFANAGAQHRTEVEPDTFAFGPTMVGAFQAGRFADGGASDIGWIRSTSAGADASGFLPATTALSSPAGPYSRVSDPSVAYDARHGVWLIASLAVGSSVTGVAVIVSRSTDGAGSWSAPIVVSAATGSADLDKEWVVCDNTTSSPHYGNCYAAWDDHGDADRLKTSTSTDGGASWSAPVGVAGNATGFGTQPVVQPDGDVIVVTDTADASAIVAFGSTDGGATWRAPVTVSPIQDHPVAGNLRAEPLPSAAVDAAGRVYVAWQDCRFRPTCAADDIVISTSDDGTTWTAPARVPIDPVTSSADHFIPGLGVDPATAGDSARLALTYYGYPQADCTQSTCQLNAGFISSSDGGGTWNAPIQIAGPMTLDWLADTTQGFMVGDYISTSFVDGSPQALVADAGPPSGGLLDEGMTLLTFPRPAVPPPPAPETAPAAPAAPSSSPAPATTRPRLTGLKIAPTAFVAASSGPSIARLPGARVSYRAVASVSTTLRLQRAATGRATGKGCAKPTRATRAARRCTRWVLLPGHFTHRDRTGLNAFRFTGRLADRALRAARYRLLATPHGTSGPAGPTARKGFHILARHRSRGARSAR